MNGKNKACLISLLLPLFGSAQMNTDIFLCDILHTETTVKATEPVNITKRKGYDNQPWFSNDGKQIYYSANYTGTNDIYVYDIAGKKNLVITNTPATSEFSPMETPDGSAVTCVFIESDTVTQRIWKINLKNRKEKVFSPYNDSIGYYWPIEKEWDENEYKSSGTGIRKVSIEQEYAVFVLGSNEHNHTLRIISPMRKLAPEKIIDDSIGRCIRQVDHYLSYVKKKADGNYLLLYDLYTRKVVSSFYMGKESEDYCWKGKTLFFTNETFIIAVRYDYGYDKPLMSGQCDFSSYGITKIKRISNHGNKFAFVADDL